jgi:predicted amidohydrolase
VIQFLGRDGFLDLARQTMTMKERLVQGLRRIDGIIAWGTDLVLQVYGSSSLDIGAIATGLRDRGHAVMGTATPSLIHLQCDDRGRPRRRLRPGRRRRAGARRPGNRHDACRLPVIQASRHKGMPGGEVRMRRPLVIAVAQPQAVSYDVAANAATHAATVRAADARVVVFPELSLTGYELDAPAVTAEDPRLWPIVEACAETSSLALAGAPVQDETGQAHIGMLSVEGTGATVAYHKMWLGGAEPERFTPGREPAVVEVDGWRLGLAICKDTGIPRHAADTAALGIDAYLAGVLESADDAAVQEERARRVATDHRVWVAVASFAGSTGGGYTQAAGRSSVWTPDGVVLARAGPETGAIVRATLS